MINKKVLQKRFNKAAPSYDEYANVQKRMGDVLIQELCSKYKHSSPEILELGCGTGYVTEQLIKAFPSAFITSVDFAPSMIEQAKKRNGTERISFVCADIENLMLSQKYDVIISNATFQWLNDLPSTINHLFEALKEDGNLVFTTFGNETFHELHTSFKKAVAFLDREEEWSIGQAFITAAQLENICKRQGAVSVQQAHYIEWFPTVRAFLDSVRKIGAANSNEGLSIQSPRIFRSMIRLYEAQFQQNGYIPATYHALFCSITKQGEKKDGTSTNTSKLEAARV
jgi:malonyl-CoA O-methyltransferase